MTPCTLLGWWHKLMMEKECLPFSGPILWQSEEWKSFFPKMTISFRFGPQARTNLSTMSSQKDTKQFSQTMTLGTSTAAILVGSLTAIIGAVPTKVSKDLFETKLKKCGHFRTSVLWKMLICSWRKNGQKWSQNSHLSIANFGDMFLS